MREFKGTKGEWYYDSDTQTIGTGHVYEGGRSYLDGVFVATAHGRIPEAERDANGELIAAAPDLLEALQLISDELTQAWNEGKLPHDCTTAKTVQKMNKAINKALGEE